MSVEDKSYKKAGSVCLYLKETRAKIKENKSRFVKLDNIHFIAKHFIAKHFSYIHS